MWEYLNTEKSYKKIRITVMIVLPIRLTQKWTLHKHPYNITNPYIIMNLGIIFVIPSFISSLYQVIDLCGMPQKYIKLVRTIRLQNFTPTYL